MTSATLSTEATASLRKKTLKILSKASASGSGGIKLKKLVKKLNSKLNTEYDAKVATDALTHNAQPGVDKILQMHKKQEAY